MLATICVAASPAAADRTLPRTYDVKRIDSTEPVAGSGFGWGLASGDVTGDGKADLLVAQAQATKGQIFIYDGVTGAHVDTINPPETNDDGSLQVLAFVYVETMPDIGSCPGGDGADAGEICDAATVGPPDGIPEIIAGAREQKVAVTPASGGPDVQHKIGRGYVFDGRTRAVLKRIDMPAADRTYELARNATPQFARLMMVPQGMAPCNGPSAENNAVGIGDCPLTDAPVRIGDVDGGGQPDIVITARNFVELRSDTAAGSQCLATATATNTCTSGKAWIYRGEEIVGTSPQTILDTAFQSIKNPVPQTGGAEFGGNVFRTGDITGGPANGAGPDGRPDFVIAARNLDYPLRAPDDAAFVDTGAAFIVNGATGAIVTNRFITSPEPQPRTQFSGSFNSGRPVGDIGATGMSDFLLPAPLQNGDSTDDGMVWAFNGDAQAGGGAEASWQFATLADPTPMLGGNFGGASTGVGDVVTDVANPANEVLIGGFGPFDPFTEASRSNITDVHFMNVTTQKNLQTITDPDRQPGSAFGVGLIPMGDLNNDGFLDFASSSYLANIGPNAGQGRAFIFTSDDSPAPTSQPTPSPSPTPTPAPAAEKQLQAGSCVQRIDGTGGADKLAGTLTGDMIFALGGDDLASGLDGDDCLDGGSGKDRLLGGQDADRLIGRSGDDSLGGGDGRDRLYGSGGRDKLAGNYGRDTLAGGDGNDRVDGGADADRLFGESGNDMLIAGDGRNRVDGGAGNDTVRARNGERDVILCGKGKDIAIIDRNDSANGCERVRRGR